MQAYTKYKAYYDKKANALNLKEQQYVYVLQPRTDHQGSKILFTEFRWIGLYIVENAPSDNKYLERKMGTNKTQVIHRMRLRLFTPRQPIPTYKQHHEKKNLSLVSSKNTIFFTREHGSPNTKCLLLTMSRHEPDNQNSPEITLRHGLANDETCTIPGTIQEVSPEIFPQTDEISGATDTDQ